MSAMTAPAARPLLFGVIALTLGAACIHIAVAPMHFLEWTPFGVSFLGAAAVQGALAGALLLTPTRRLLALSVVANIALVVVWAISRSVGLPVGPAPWR